jgi:hypothetical protein
VHEQSGSARIAGLDGIRGGPIPCGNYQTSTLISGIRWDGPCAPWLFEGPMNGEMFLAWVEQGLAPVLRAGELVIREAPACLAPQPFDGIEIRRVGRQVPQPGTPRFNRFTRAPDLVGGEVVQQRRPAQ